MLGSALLYLAGLEQQLEDQNCKQTDVAVKLALNRLTSKTSEAVRALEALEANTAVVAVADLRAAYTSVANKFSSLDSQQKAVAHFASICSEASAHVHVVVGAGGSGGGSGGHKDRRPRERTGRCKFHDAGACTHGDKCRWNHVGRPGGSARCSSSTLPQTLFFS